LWDDWRSALLIVKPETVIAWHRQGFRLYWRWKSRRCDGRPSVSPEVRNLIRQMSVVNPRWDAPRIHGELLKIGIELSQATIAKYMARHRKPAWQMWRTFLKNHTKNLVSLDFFLVCPPSPFSSCSPLGVYQDNLKGGGSADLEAARGRTCLGEVQGRVAR
jgi:hypothetical protein